MAKRSTTRRVARVGNGKAYNFSYKRKAALYRAAKISADKRRKNRIKTVALTAGVIGTVGVGAYLGHRHGPAAVQAVRNYKPLMAVARNKMAARIAVNPLHAEKVRIASSVAVAPPSATSLDKLPMGHISADSTGQVNVHHPAQTVAAAIPDSAKAAAQVTRDAMAQEALPPHMGGPDNRLYNPDDSVNTAAMVDRSVARVTGTQTASLTGTPGGTKTHPKANPTNAVEDAYWDSILRSGPTGAAAVKPAKKAAGQAVKAVTGTETPAHFHTPPSSSAPKEVAGRLPNERAAFKMAHEYGKQQGNPHKAQKNDVKLSHQLKVGSKARYKLGPGHDYYGYITRVSHKTVGFVGFNMEGQKYEHARIPHFKIQEG